MDNISLFGELSTIFRNMEGKNNFGVEKIGQVLYNCKRLPPLKIYHSVKEYYYELFS